MGSICCCCCNNDDKEDEINEQKPQQQNRQQDIEHKTKSLQRPKSQIHENHAKVQKDQDHKVHKDQKDKDKSGSNSGKGATDASNPTNKDNSSKKETVFKSNDEEEQGDEKKLIEDEKLKEELKHAVRGGDSAYGKVNLRKKSLSNSQYNKEGLVDPKSNEFKFVKNFMHTRGYEVSESIGSGNYAEVYKAFNEKKNKNVAVKVIDLKKANPNYRVNFLPREIAILRQLKHKNIIKIYEISQTGNKIIMVMEWAANGTIADWLKTKGSFTEPVAGSMFKEVLEALHYMHSGRIAHRDLKLENILVTVKLNPKLSDFSYAIIVDPKKPLSETFCGSLPYFSPEILQRKPYNPFLTDIWSLGVCLFIMLNDGLPFKIGDDRAMLNKQLSGDWHFRKRIHTKLSPQLKSMVRKMLEPDVNKRATTTSLMNDPWILKIQTV